MFDFLFRHISVPKRQSDYKFSVWIIICTEKYLQIIRAAIGMTLLSFRTFSIHIDVMVFDIWPAHFSNQKSILLACGSRPLYDFLFLH